MQKITFEKIEKGLKDFTPDPMAAIVRDAFRVARAYRASYRLGENTIDEVIQQCRDQYNGVPDCHERELMDAANVPLKVSLTKHKIDVLEAWIRDLLAQSADSPFVVTPSPIPHLSEDDYRAAGRDIALEHAGNPEDAPLSIEDDDSVIEEYAKKHLGLTHTRVMEKAQERARLMQQTINDQLVNGDFRRQYMEFMRNLIQFPYAVMFGPVMERKNMLQWSGNSLTDKSVLVPVVKNVDPSNYFWSPETKRAGQGQFDIIREQVTREYLYSVAKSKYWIQGNIKKCLENYNTYRSFNHDWPFFTDKDSPDQGFLTEGLHKYNDSVTILRYFGSVSGKVLKEYKIEGVPDDEYREIEAVVLGDVTLRLRVRAEPLSAGRPIYATSYTKSTDSLAGYGVAQIIRPVERAYMGALRCGLANAAFSAAPTGEVDTSRVHEFMDDVQAVQVIPGTMMPVTPSSFNTTESAYRFHTIPNNTESFLNLMRYFQQLSDQLTGLPAALSGQPVGTGVNRTYRGVAQLYRNALKGVQSAFTNVDNDVLEPLGKSYYVNNMLYNEDDKIKGDSQVVAKGMAGLLEKELNSQERMEFLQFALPFASSGDVPPAVIQSILQEAAEDAGFSKEKWDEAMQQAREEQMQAQQMQQMQEMQQAMPPQGEAPPEAMPAVPDEGEVPPPPVIPDV